MSEVKLVDNGLYVASHLGSLRLPSSQMDLRKLRTLLERLFTLKKIIVGQKAYYDMIEHSECATRKSIEFKQNTERSPYSPSHQSSPSSPSLLSTSSSNEGYITWVRGTWFSPSKKKDRKYEGEWNPSLFSPLQ
ncbi:MAG: hypothetical protein EXX96DRAFT_571212 [Benjaminiella poitrasii]|nr:MAG: hypothetical protein EXX96DRAFT_571212 [Benjaminiella poitrasii]